jgi:hypothetical protein
MGELQRAAAQKACSLAPYGPASHTSVKDVTVIAALRAAICP